MRIFRPSPTALYIHGSAKSLVLRGRRMKKEKRGSEPKSIFGLTFLLCGKSYRCPVLGTRFGSTGTWYSPGPSAGEHHLPLVLVYHHDRQRVTGLLFFVVPT